MKVLALTVGLFFVAAPAAAAPSVTALVRSATTAPGLPKLYAARRALQAGRGEAARRQLAGYDGPLPEVARALEIEARVAIAAPLPEALLAPLLRPPEGCPVEDDPRRLVPIAAAAAALAKREPGRAAALLERLEPSGEVLAQIRDTWAAVGTATAAARAARADRRLLTEFPDSPPARARAEALGAEGVAEALGAVRARWARVRALLDAHANAAALAEADALAETLADDPVLSCELGYVRGKALRKLRRYRAAQRALQATRKACGGDPRTRDFALRAALIEARVRGIRGQRRGTKRVATWFEATAPGHSYADDAWLLHAETVARRDPAAARAVYARIAAEYPEGDYAPTAAWRVAFEAIQAGRWADARPLLEGILAHPVPRAIEHARARYWLGRIALEAGDEAAARGHFEAIVLRPSFYGWLALDRLAKSHPAWVTAWTAELGRSAARDAEVPAADLGPARAAARRAGQMLALGLDDWAEAELASVACEAADVSTRRAVAAAFAAVRAYRASQMMVRADEAWRAAPVDPATWRLAYSRPFAPEIEAAAAAEELDPLFLTALSREESTFDPEIVSWAGATGLAQLMPATAVGAYADVFGGRLDPARLTEPALNLRLGAHVLADGMRRFGRVEALALAAYNGGPGLARRFVPARATPFDVWVETPSVKETRRYIKRVLETYGIYLWLHGDRFLALPDAIRP